MDLQIYYKKIREIERGIKEPAAVVVSLDTPDGGREGRLTEATPYLAAKMVVEGMARLATPDEARKFQEQKAEAKKKADQLAAASKMKFAVISPSELRGHKGERTGD